MSSAESAENASGSHLEQVTAADGQLLLSFVHCACSAPPTAPATVSLFSCSISMQVELGRGVLHFFLCVAHVRFKQHSIAAGNTATAWRRCWLGGNLAGQADHWHLRWQHCLVILCSIGTVWGGCSCAQWLCLQRRCSSMFWGFSPCSCLSMATLLECFVVCRQLCLNSYMTS